MSAYLPYIISFAVFTSIGAVFALAAKGNSKTDKGFQLIYLRLSYRRRIKRDLISTPVVFAVIVALYYSAIWPMEIIIALALFMLLVYIVQFTYNIRMWKKHEKFSSGT